MSSVFLVLLSIIWYQKTKLLLNGHLNNNVDNFIYMHTNVPQFLPNLIRLMSACFISIYRISPHSKCNIFLLRLRDMLYGALFGSVYTEIWICILNGVFTAVKRKQTHCLFPVYGQLCVSSWILWDTQTNKPSFCKAGVEAHAPKKSPHFCSEGETYKLPLLNIMKDQDMIRF